MMTYVEIANKIFFDDIMPTIKSYDTDIFPHINSFYIFLTNCVGNLEH